MVGIMDEINEEIRQEKLENFWRDNGSFIVVSVLLVILAVGGRAFWENHKADRNMERTSALIQAVEGDDLPAYIETAEDTHKMIAALTQAAGNEDPAAAAGQYQAVAENTDFPQIYRELALLMSVGSAATAGGDIDRAALIKQLEPLAAESAFQASAIELQAFLYAALDDYKAAIAAVDRALALDKVKLPGDFRMRMEALRDYYETRRQES